MEKYIIPISLFVIFSALNIILKKKKVSFNKKNDNCNNIIRQPKLYAIVGIGGLMIFTSGAAYAFVDNAWPYAIIILLIVPLYLFFVLLRINWKIEIFADEFEYTNLWRKKRKYKFQEVKVKQLSRSTRIYKNEKHLVGISYLQDNWSALETAIYRYKKLHE